jgi:hypothetical protein
MHPFQVVGEGYQRPLPGNGLESPEGELPESKNLFYDPEYRLYRALSSTIGLTAIRCFQLMGHQGHPIVFFLSINLGRLL